MLDKLLNKIVKNLSVASLKQIFGLNEEQHEFFDNQDLKKVINAIKRPALAKFFPYVAYDEAHELFINKNSVGMIFAASPLLGSSEEIEKQFTDLFQNVLPKGANIQFLLLASPRISPLLKIWEQARWDQGELYQQLAKRRRKFLEDQAMNNNNTEFMTRNIRILISVSLPGATLDAIRVKHLNQLKTQLLTIFSDVGMPSSVIDAKGLIDELYDWLNPSVSLTPINIDYNPLEPISKQLLDHNTCIKVTAEQITIKNSKEEQVIQVLTPKKYPEQWCLSEMSQFIGSFFEDGRQIPCPFMLHYGVHISDEAMLQTRMMTKCSNAEKMAATPIAKWVPSIKEEAVEWGYVREQVSHDHRFVKTQFTVLLFAKTSHITDAKEKTITMLKNKGWEMAVESYTNLLTFIACLPMSWGEGAVFDQTLFGKAKTTLSSEPTNLLPIQGEWLGNNTPNMLLVGRRGQIFFWDPFENRSGNFNVAIAGKSGAGKSVFMAELIICNLGRGGRSFVLDVGRSYEKVCKLIEGTFIEFSTHSPICINPFTSIPIDNPEESIDALAMLKPIIALMAAPTQGTTDLENALLEKAILNVWEVNKNNASISDVADFLQQQAEPRAQKLAKMLFPYTKNGSYGRFFEGTANVNLAGDLMVFELEELKERKDLQAVIVQIMVLQIANQVYLGDRTTPVQVVLDEAWDMLRGKQTGLFIETAARRLRKYRGALIVGTQSVRDFYAAPGAQAAFENSDFTVLLEQKSSSITQLKTSKHIDLTSYMEKVLKSVKTVKGKYSECFIIMPSGFVVGRLFLDRFAQLLYTTDPKEFEQIESLRQQGASLAKALEMLTYER
jgi:conjugal transfer ATP-binding protein TraC